MNDKKQTGARAAAKEIIMLQQRWFSGEETPEPDEQEDAVLAIIANYCPEDKRAAGKLVEACRAALRFQKVIDIDRLPESIRFRAAPLTVKLQTAITEYERMKK